MLFLCLNLIKVNLTAFGWEARDARPCASALDTNGYVLRVDEARGARKENRLINPAVAPERAAQILIRCYDFKTCTSKLQLL